MKYLPATLFCLLLASCAPKEQPLPCDRGYIAHLEDEVHEQEAEIRRLTLAVRDAALNDVARLRRLLSQEQAALNEMQQKLADEQTRCN